MKRIWIVTELFYPEETSTAYILTKIAQRLTEKYDVHVICGPENYNKNSLVIENSKSQLLNDNITIQRVSDTKLDKNKLLSRIIRFIILSWKLSYSLWKNLESNDSILIVTNPAPLLLIISIIKRIRKNKLYILVHDVFPENTIPANIIASSDSLLYRILKKIFDFAYRQADTLIVLGRDMKDVIKKKLGANKRGTDIQIIENWAEIDRIVPNKTKNLEMFLSNPKIDIQYAGNIGRVQGLMNFLHIIKSIENPYLRFSFWGEGACKQEMVKYVEDEKMQNIYFFNGYARNEQSSVLNNCDIAIVILAPGMYGLGVPSKAYNIMAAGKPILFIGDINSEIALEVKENKIGFCFEAEDSQGLFSFFQSLNDTKLFSLSEMGKKARYLAETKYSAQKILDKFIQVI